MSDPPASSASPGFGANNDFSNSRSDGARPASAAILSPPVADFIGRNKERAELGAVLRGCGAALIRGMGGLGKTQLALRLAADVGDAFPDGQLLIELRGGSPERRTPEEALRTALWALRGPAERLPDDLPSLAALYRATLGGRRMLVLVDDAPDSASARHFIPPAPCALLVTSRERITLDVQTRTLDLSALSEQESRDLLLHLARRLDGDPLLPELLRRCANLPLALRIVGDALRERPDLPSERYLARLNDEKRRLGALKHEDRDVYAIIGFSDTLLAERDPALADRWRMLHVCPAPFERAVVVALWEEEDEDALDDSLGELLRRSLLRYDEAERRYSLHDLLRDVARQRCPVPAAESAHERHARYFCGLANESGDLYKQGGEDVLRGLALFDSNLAHIVAGQGWAAGRVGVERLVINYALGSPYILSLRLHPRTQIIWIEAARAAAQASDDKGSEGAALGNLGNAYRNLGEVERAIGFYEQWLEIARAIGNRNGEGAALGNLGNAYKNLGEVERAIGFYEQWLKIARAIGDRRGEGGALGNLGIAYRNLGEVERAIGFYEQQLEIVRAIGDRRGEGNALGNLGIAYRNLGEVERAIGFYEQQLEIARAIGDRNGEGAALGNLGNAYKNLGEVERAIGFYEQWLKIARAIGDRSGEAGALGNLGIAYRDLGEVERAIGFYEQQLEIGRSIGDRAGESRACWNLGVAMETQGEYGRAAELMQHYVDYLRELGHPDAEQHAARVEQVRRKAKA